MLKENTSKSIYFRLEQNLPALFVCCGGRSKSAIIAELNKIAIEEKLKNNNGKLTGDTYEYKRTECCKLFDDDNSDSLDFRY